MKIHRQQQEDWREKLQLHPNQHHNLNLTRALAHPNQQILTQTHHQNHILTHSLIQKLGPVTDPVGFSSEHKDSEYMPNQQYKLSGSHPESTDCAQAPPFTLHTGPQQTWSSLHSVDTGGLFYNRGSMVNGLHLSRQDSVSKSWADTQ